MHNVILRFRRSLPEPKDLSRALLQKHHSAKGNHGYFPVCCICC